MDELESVAVQCARKLRAGGVISYSIGKDYYFWGEPERGRGEEEEHFLCSLLKPVKIRTVQYDFCIFLRGFTAHLVDSGGESTFMWRPTAVCLEPCFQVGPDRWRQGASKLFLAVYRDLEGFSNLLGVLLCLGFKQVSLDVQDSCAGLPHCYLNEC